VKAFTDAEKAKWTAAWNTMSPEIKSAMAFFWASSERLVRRKADKLEAENIRLRAALESIAAVALIPCPHHKTAGMPDCNYCKLENALRSL
jgi:hypothetical protein